MTRPNILFIHVDQLHYQWLSAYGNKQVHTPNLDRLAAEGMSFMRAESTNPVCGPARTSWYTGRMSCEHGCMSNSMSCLKEIPDLGQWMSPRGYGCYFVGKWHVPGHNKRTSFNYLSEACGIGERGDATVTRAAEGFLKNYRGDKPFFLNVGYLNPHDCCFLSQQPHMKLGLSGPLAEELPPKPETFDPAVQVEGRPATDDWGEAGVRVHQYYYNRMVEMVDGEIGRLMDVFRSSRFADNTLVLFASDHGEMLGNRNRFGKMQPYEHAVRIPLICWFPGKISAGVRNTTHMVSSVDIVPTVLDYAGIDMMPGLTVARSIRPILEGEDISWRDYLVSECLSHQGLKLSVRTPDGLKTIFTPGNSDVEMYDPEKDPQEQRNLAGEPGYSTVLEQHRGFRDDFLSKMKLHPEAQNFRYL